MFGLFMGAVALGLRGTGAAVHATENYKLSKNLRYMEKWDRYYYYDRNNRMHDANTGHWIKTDIVRVLSDGTYINKSYIGYPQNHLLLIDLDNHSVLLDITEKEKRDKAEKLRREGKSEEFIKQMMDIVELRYKGWAGN